MPQINVTIRVIAKIEYRKIICGFLKPYLLNFRLKRPPILLNRSCPIPSGHKNEQYVLPVNNVIKRTTIKPAAAIVARSTKLKTDGTNWRKSKRSTYLAGTICIKSTKTRIKQIKTSDENAIRKLLR